MVVFYEGNKKELLEIATDDCGLIRYKGRYYGIPASEMNIIQALIKQLVYSDSGDGFVITEDIYENRPEISDINGDDDKETIMITRNMTPGHSSDMLLTIRNKSNDIIFSKDLEEGIAPEIFVGDFDGDRINDVFTSVDSGGSGGYRFYNLITYKEKAFKEIPLGSIDVSNHMEFEFKNDYAYLHSDLLVSEVKFKLSEENLEMYRQLVHDNHPVVGFAPTWLEPKDYDNDGVYELEYETIFKVDYKYNIAHITIPFKYTESKWVPLGVQTEEIILE